MTKKVPSPKKWQIQPQIFARNVKKFKLQTENSRAFLLRHCDEKRKQIKKKIRQVKVVGPHDIVQRALIQIDAAEAERPPQFAHIHHSIRHHVILMK